MKLKSLLLGSAAALALSTGAQAADPLTEFVSLGVCDAYGISGLTLESDDTCLKISGSVSYEFRVGDYGDGAAWFPYYGDGGGVATVMNDDDENDWRSRLEAVLKFEATTQTDAGAASAVLSLRERQYSGGGSDEFDWLNDGHPIRFQEAYVSFGDTTVIMAGMKGSIAKDGSDEPFNYLGLFNSSEVDTGVDWKFGENIRTGGTSIQVVSEFGDGISAGIGLENINRWGTDSAGGHLVNHIVTDGDAGTLVGFVEARGDWGDAHLTILGNDALNGFDDAVWGFHAGGTFSFDQFALRAALSGNSEEYLNGLLSAEGTFDLFTIAASAEFASVGAANPDSFGVDTLGVGFGGSVGFQATETVAINLGARYWDFDSSDELGLGDDTGVWEVALGATFALTETLSIDGKVGYRGVGEDLAAFTGSDLDEDGDFYGQIGVAYNPGGGFETGGSIEVNSLGGYRVNFDASKSF